MTQTLDPTRHRENEDRYRAWLDRTIREGGDWLQHVPPVAWRWKHGAGPGVAWSFTLTKPGQEQYLHDVRALYSNAQLRMAYRIGAKFGLPPTPEGQAAADAEYDSWRDVAMNQRDVYCPGGYARHKYSPVLDRPGYFFRCRACGHHSPYPF